METLFGALGTGLLVASAVLIAIAAIFVRYRFAYWRCHNIPFAEPSFPFGNFADVFRQRRSFSTVISTLYNATNEPVLGVFIILEPSLLVLDPQLIRTVCIKDFSNFQDRGLYCNEKEEPLTGHLFSIAGEKWRRLRIKLSPSFTSGKLRAMFNTLVDSGVPLRQTIAAAAVGEGTVVEMRELVAKYTTNAIASAAFGLNIDSFADPETAFRVFGRKAFEPSAASNIRRFVANSFPSLFRLLRLRVIDADVEEFFMSVVRQNAEHRDSNNVVRKDFFQLLMQLRRGGVQEDGVWHTQRPQQPQQPRDQHDSLTMDECAAQSFVFFLAGFETSSSTVSFALYELAANSDCQRRVQREIDEVLARHGGAVTYESVSDMKYLDWCFDETLRKYPPLPVLNRQCSADWHIPDSNMVVAAGTKLMIPVHALQWDPKYYPQPERFQPERFDPQHEAFSARRPYLPFGEGPRNCIGMRYGKMQSKVALVCMLQEFWYELAGNTCQPLVMDPLAPMLSPVGGLQLRVRQRCLSAE